MLSKDSILVTGGAGFIGTNFIKYLLDTYKDTKVICLDKLTYAGNLRNLSKELEQERFTFVKGDIANTEIVEHILKEDINCIVNFAAESHVDRSIKDSQIFLKSNIFGTHNLLECARKKWELGENKFKDNVRFIHISTDEVYGSIKQGSFNEMTSLDPRNPYSASKASSDLIVKSYMHTHNFPAIITRCSNNYGPYQFPEKLIPLMINNILKARGLPVYGDGSNIRDWIYVMDHCKAIDLIRQKGQIKDVYNIGGDSEITNIELVKLIIDKMKLLAKEDKYKTFFEDSKKVNYDLIKFVKDRKGHDKRYSMNFSKLNKNLNWKPEANFEQGIDLTVRWYLDNIKWMKDITSGNYQTYYEKMYGGIL
ncbi:dTDP-glucose 4,6-dehydratase [Candidatus Woesearchaeota archaeon]|jgi:dTDP-glucose 4,6-dehydratase|nr:dTDP-glucose 4,6-dehydratase [Candidatus Woesearchaeota archaeon]